MYRLLIIEDDKGIADAIRKANHHFCTMVVVAAGSSTRMGQDKMMLELDGKPLVINTLQALDLCPTIDEVILVTSADKVETLATECRKNMVRKVSKVIVGGATRTQSALAGVCEADKRARLIGIHDGARPFVTWDMVQELVHNAYCYHAAAPAIPVKDTIRIAENNVGVSTPSRSNTFAIQTPQIFDADLIKGALTAAVASGANYTDDCAAVEAMGVSVRLTKGSEDNIKLTTPMDLALARMIVDKRKGRTI